MKILYVITKSNWGGAQRHVFDLSTAMKKRGHTVVVALGGLCYFAVAYLCNAMDLRTRIAERRNRS